MASFEIAHAEQHSQKAFCVSSLALRFIKFDQLYLFAIAALRALGSGFNAFAEEAIKRALKRRARR
jgi:hypothetical protein